MTKLSDLMGELAEVLDQHRIWEELRNHLRRYADDEISNREVLKKDDGTAVSLDAVDVVILELDKKLKSLEGRVEEIQNLEIGNGKSKKASPKKSKSSTVAAEGGSEEGGEEAVKSGRRPRRGKNPGVGPRRKPGSATAGG